MSHNKQNIIPTLTIQIILDSWNISLTEYYKYPEDYVKYCELWDDFNTGLYDSHCPQYIGLTSNFIHYMDLECEDKGYCNCI